MSRAYGPHDPDTAPKVVVMHQAGRYFGGIARTYVTLPIPEELARQREGINTVAWRQGMAEPD